MSKRVAKKGSSSMDTHVKDCRHMKRDNNSIKLIIIFSNPLHLPKNAPPFAPDGLPTPVGGSRGPHCYLFSAGRPDGQFQVGVPCEATFFSHLFSVAPYFLQKVR
jgi:hypothetical protein